MIRFRRYPSKNCVRLTAEVERMSGREVVWGSYVVGDSHELVLTLGDILQFKSRPLDPAAADNVAALDAEKRGLLVRARADLRGLGAEDDA